MLALRGSSFISDGLLTTKLKSCGGTWERLTSVSCDATVMKEGSLSSNTGAGL